MANRRSQLLYQKKANTYNKEIPSSEIIHFHIEAFEDQTEMVTSP